MRYVFAALLMVAPAHAWEFTPGQPCLLTHETAEARVELTYDPTAPFYTITITRDAPWPEAAQFGMGFAGPQGRQIGTDRHVLSDGNRTLTVTDRGFGNVLDGLQFNQRAYAYTGDTVIGFDLDGAAGPVAAFRACDPTPPLS